MDTNERKRSLKSMGFDFMEKKMLRTLLEGLASMSLHMGCHVRSVIVNLQLVDSTLGAEGVKMLITMTNSENAQFIDLTATAQEMRDEEPLWDDLAEKILAMLKEAATVFNTQADNVVFQCWTANKEGEPDIKRQIKPKTGFPATEVIPL